MLKRMSDHTNSDFRQNAKSANNLHGLKMM